MAQTNYGYEQPLGVPGGIYDLSHKRIVTRTLDSGTEIRPGMGMVVGTAKGETAAAAASTSTKADFEGVVVHGSKNMEHGWPDGDEKISGSEVVGLMQKGRIWVSVASTATIAYKTAAALITSGDNAGKFTDSADEGETSKVALDAYFTGVSDTDNGIAVVEL